MTAKKAYYYDIATGDPIDEEDALEDSGIMRDGVALKVPMFMRDSAGNVLTDAMGEPLDPRWNCRGFVFVDNSNRERVIDDLHPDVQKAYISSAWKGGVKPGDVVNINGRQMIGTHFTDEGVEFVDINTLDGDELKKRAYDESKKALGERWKPKKAQREPSDREWEISGPLSDLQSSELKERAWRVSVEELQNAWRK